MDVWYEKLSNLCVDVSVKTLIKAWGFRYDNWKKNVSFFDCVGYIFSKENNYIFVIGDKEFKNMGGVKHITK